MLIQYLIKQSRKPSGLVGRLITNIWSSYFKNSAFGNQTNHYPQQQSDFRNRLWRCSTIKNLLELDKNLDIHGIDISEESYHTARRIHSDAIENRSVKLRIGNVANLPYQNNDFDLVFAIQTHIFWEDLKQSFQEIYRVMSNPSTLIIASEKEKIKYHMTDYGTSHELKQLLASIGFSKIEEKQNYKWVVYVVTKSDQEIKHNKKQ